MKVHDPEIPIKAPIDTVEAFYYRGETGKDATAGWSVTRSNLDQMNEIIKILDEVFTNAMLLGAPVLYPSIRTGWLSGHPCS